MEFYIILAVIILFFAIAGTFVKKKGTIEKKDNYDYSNGYKPKWLFSYNEKDAFSKIKNVTDELGLYLFAKVRLYDLVEPKQNVEKKQGHIFKVQAKHVDFVVCDKKLVAKAIIELDDASHDREDRKERDSFVDTVLTSCGYKVLHTRAVMRDEIMTFLMPFRESETNTQTANTR